MNTRLAGRTPGDRGHLWRRSGTRANPRGGWLADVVHGRTILRSTAMPSRFGSMPRSCRISRLRPAGSRSTMRRVGLGVRMDSALYDGYSIPPYYDSLIAKLIVHGRDRPEALGASVAGAVGTDRRWYRHHRAPVQRAACRKRPSRPVTTTSTGWKSGWRPTFSRMIAPGKCERLAFSRCARLRPMSDRSLTPELLAGRLCRRRFPMAETRDDPEVFWVDPQERGVLPLDGFHMSRSLARRMRAATTEQRLNRPFEAMIDGCADGMRPGSTARSAT